MTPVTPMVWTLLALLSTQPTLDALGHHSWQSRDPDAGPLDHGVVGRIGSAKLRHGATVRSLTFSPDGVLLVSADRQGAVMVWEVATGRLVRRWDLPDGLRGPVGFSADGRRVAWGTADGYVRSNDIRTGLEVRAFRTHSPYGIRSIDAGRIVVTDLAGSSRAWDEETGRPGDTVTPEARPTDVASPCGRYAASVTTETVLVCRDRSCGTDQEIGSGPYRFARTGALRFSADGRHLYVAEVEGGIVRVDREAGRAGTRYGPFLYYPPDRLAVSGDGSCLAVAAGNRVHLFDAATGAERFPQGEHFSQPPAVRLSRDGRSLILSGCYPAPREETWDLATLRRTAVTSVPIADWQGGTPAYPRRSPDGRVRVTHGGDTQFNQFDTSILRFWDEHGVPLWMAKKGLAGRAGYGFSMDGSLVCVVEDKGLGVYESATGRPLDLVTYETPLGFREWAGAVAFTPDRTAVVSAHPSGLVYSPLGGGGRPREVRLPKGESLEGREGLLAVSPDGRLAVVGTDRLDLVVFELATLQERFRISTRARGPAGSALFARDGRHLIVGNGDSTVTVHDLAAGPGPLPSQSDLASESVWGDLSGDAAAAFRAVRLLAANPDAAVGGLRARVPPPAPPGEHVTRYVSLLDAPRYQSRETAQSQLARLAHHGRPALLAVSRSDLSLEMRQRVESLLRATRGPDLSPDGLRAVRSVEVLERIGSPAARGLLREWATGPVGDTLVESARSALARAEGR